MHARALQTPTTLSRTGTVLNAGKRPVGILAREGNEHGCRIDHAADQTGEELRTREGEYIPCSSSGTNTVDSGRCTQCRSLRGHILRDTKVRSTALAGGAQVRIVMRGFPSEEQGAWTGTGDGGMRTRGTERAHTYVSMASLLPCTVLTLLIFCLFRNFFLAAERKLAPPSVPFFRGFLASDLAYVGRLYDRLCPVSVSASHV